MIARTERDHEVLDALAFKVRMLSLDQVARAWWGSATDARRLARRRLAKLEDVGLVERREVLSRPLLELREPVSTWQPGDAEPDHGAISWKLRMRWTEAPRVTMVVIASRRALNELGGRGGRLPNLGQETHDLHTSELYLRLLEADRERAARWVGEEHLKPQRQRGEKVPDALIVDQLGEPELAVEFAGCYPRRRVEAFHLDCVERGLAYELW